MKYAWMAVMLSAACTQSKDFKVKLTFDPPLPQESEHLCFPDAGANIPGDPRFPETLRVTWVTDGRELIREGPFDQAIDLEVPAGEIESIYVEAYWDTCQAYVMDAPVRWSELREPMILALRRPDGWGVSERYADRDGDGLPKCWEERLNTLIDCCDSNVTAGGAADDLAAVSSGSCTLPCEGAGTPCSHSVCTGQADGGAPQVCNRGILD